MLHTSTVISVSFFGQIISISFFFGQQIISISLITIGCKVNNWAKFTTCIKDIDDNWAIRNMGISLTKKKNMGISNMSKHHVRD